MSKTQDKRAARLAEAKEFVTERHRRNLEIFQSNFEVGLKIYEANKDQLSPEQILELEANIESNKKTIEEYKAKWL